MKRKSLNLGGSRSTEDNTNEVSTTPEVKPASKATKAEVEKARVTHYLSTDILGALEEVYDELRRKLPYAEKSKVKKSHLVDFALQHIVDDFHKKGDKSMLIKEFIKK
jgi:hypothetical protein